MVRAGYSYSPNTVGSPLYSGYLGTRKEHTDYRGVLISGVKGVLSIENHLVPVVYYESL